MATSSMACRALFPAVFVAPYAPLPTVLVAPNVPLATVFVAPSVPLATVLVAPMVPPTTVFVAPSVPFATVFVAPNVPLATVFVAPMVPPTTVLAVPKVAFFSLVPMLPVEARDSHIFRVFLTLFFSSSSCVGVETFGVMDLTLCVLDCVAVVLYRIVVIEAVSESVSRADGYIQYAVLIIDRERRPSEREQYVMLGFFAVLIASSMCVPYVRGE
mmetsp:Transcript_22459/g.55574  ORF Transcript_22459/g.55574 Transcript_22459/m.55574 type:complete len:215 (-) Transcript_22459:114-758(-)